MRGLTQFGANLCVVGDDDQTIYQWRGSEVSNIVTFADRYDGVRQVTLADNFRSSEGIVEVGRSVAELIPPEQRLPKAMVAAGIRSRSEATSSPSISRTRERRRRGSATASRLSRASPSQTSPIPSREVCRGRTSPCCSAPWRTTPGRSSRRCASGASLTSSKASIGCSTARRSRPSSASSRYMNGEIDSSDLESSLGGRRPAPGRRRLGRGDDGPRRGPRLRPRRALGCLQHPAPLPGVPRSAGPARGDGPRRSGARELVFYQLGKFSQAISDFEEIYFNTAPQAEVRDLRRLARPTRRPATTPSRTPTSATPPRTPSCSRPSTRPRACSGRPCSCPACATTGSRPRVKGGLGLFHVIPRRRDQGPRPLPRDGSRTRPASSTSR